MFFGSICIIDRPDRVVRACNGYDAECVISKEDKKTINSVVQQSKKYSSAQLTEITKLQKPWIESYVKREATEITNKCIFDYFNKSE